MAERTALESEIIRKCLSRSELQCSFLEYRGYKVSLKQLHDSVEHLSVLVLF